MYKYFLLENIFLQVSTDESANSPNIFQHKMNDLINGFEFICEYINDILVLKKGT